MALTMARVMGLCWPVLLLILSGCCYAQRIDYTFCPGKAPGIYCNLNATDSMIVCPLGLLQPCPHGRYCLSKVPVSGTYACELPFSPFLFCSGLGSGTYCANPATGFYGIVQCPQGVLVECEKGKACQGDGLGHAFCGPKKRTRPSPQQAPEARDMIDSSPEDHAKQMDRPDHPAQPHARYIAPVQLL